MPSSPTSYHLPSRRNLPGDNPPHRPGRQLQPKTLHLPPNPFYLLRNNITLAHLYYVVFQEAGDDAGWGAVIEAVGWIVGSEVREDGEEVGVGGAGVGLEALFGEGMGVEDGLYSGRRGGGEHLGGKGGVLYVVEGEAGSVGGASVVYGVQVAGGNAGFEDEVFVGIGDAGAVIYYDQMPVAAPFERGGYVDVVRTSVAGIAQELAEGVLDGAEVAGAAASAFRASQAGEAGAEVAVGAFHARLP